MKEKMKTILRISVLCVLSVFLVAEYAVAQERGNKEARMSPNASVSQTIGTTVISLNYGRPGIKGRTYFAEDSDLAPLGSVWRTGANEATSISFSDNVMFGGEEVEAGTYALYTIPGEDEWTVILNSKQSWGTQYDENQDVVRVSAEVMEGYEAEWFNIYFNELSNNSANMILHWGNKQVVVPISVK